ncbi:hypothetical protein LY474_35820 [Myxococcus stipitatus]|nr:hypothetical protein [Myxococcus stipitatus]MCE9673189.1 hypothetical protein [Myxococcus stipitatus]
MSRARSELEAELAHVYFLLDEMNRWEASEVPMKARRFLSERYERQARILLSALAESAPAESAAKVEAPVAAENVEGRGLEGVDASGVAKTDGRDAGFAPTRDVGARPESVGQREVLDAGRAEVESRVAGAAAMGARRDEAAGTESLEAGAVPVGARRDETVGIESLEAGAASLGARRDEAVGAESLVAGASPVGAHGEGPVGVESSREVSRDAPAEEGVTVPLLSTPNRDEVGREPVGEEDVAWDGRNSGAEPGSRVQDEETGARVPPRSTHDGAPAESFGSPPLPENEAEPMFEVPRRPSVTARIVEQTSTWDRVWRPFLYDSIMWFVGAFLILSGALYFVFESWAGMSSGFRSLTVFALTAGQSAGFSLLGAYLARREALRNPGRILGLIGSASAPLAGVALGPMAFGDMVSLGGVNTALLVPLLVVWSGVAAVLVRKPADASDAPSRPFVQMGLVLGTLMMGLAPLAARLGAAALWLNVLPCVLFFLVATRPVPQPRDTLALAFAMGASLYLLLVHAVRLHVALAAVGGVPHLGIYAPFGAFLLATALRFRPLPPERSADALTLGVAAVQVMCLIGSVGAPAPSLFVTAAIITWTMVTLTKGAVSRLPWAYGAYGAAYFAYSSVAQLVPGPLRQLIDALKLRLGYVDAEPLPVQYGALTALPFVVAGVVLAVTRLWRGERTGQARDTALAEVLLRSTAVASVLFTFYSLAGPDSRPGLWCVLGVALICLAVGLLVERFYLTAVGALLTLLVPVLAIRVADSATASAVSGVVALLLSGVVLLSTARTRSLLSPIVALLASGGVLMGLASTVGFASGTGMVLSGAAALVVAWTLRSPAAMAYGAWLAAWVLPKLLDGLTRYQGGMWLVAVALALAVLGTRGGLVRLLGLPAFFYAVVGLGWGVFAEPPLLGVTVLVAAAAVAVASREFSWMRPIAVVIAALAMLPDMRLNYEPWGGWMTPERSMGLLIVWGFGSSLAAVRWGRSASTTVAALVAMVFPLMCSHLAGSSDVSGVLLGAAVASLLTARALLASVSLGVACLYALAGVASLGPVEMLALAVVLSVLAVLEEVPTVLRVGAGGHRFSMVATVGAMVGLGIVVVTWAPESFLLLVAAIVVLPLLWTRANRRPFFASLCVPYTAVALLAYGEGLPGWVQVLPLVALALVRGVEHVPSLSSLVLRSNEVAARNAMSQWMQIALGCVAPFAFLSHAAFWMDPVALYAIAAALALMPGPQPFLRVSGASLLMLAAPQARPVVTGLLLLLALAEHHAPSVLWSFFRSPPDALLRRASVGVALVLAAVPLLDAPTSIALAGAALVVFASAFLLSLRWLLTPAVWLLALSTVGQTDAHRFLEWRPEAGLALVAVALGAALLSALCQTSQVHQRLSWAAAKVTPGLEGTWSEPLWVGGVGVLGLLLVGRLADSGPGGLPPLVAVGAGLTSVVLMVARERWMASVATGLLAVSLVAAVPFAWAPAVVGGAGLVLCLAGLALDARDVRVGAALHHGGWVLTLLALWGLRDLEHVSMPLSILFALGAAWTVVLRRREREVVGWLASLAAVHGWLMHLGAVYSSGRGSAFILPYFGAASAVLAVLALLLAGRGLRRGVGHGFTVVALGEVLLGLMVLGAVGDGLREALVSSVALAALLFTLVRRAAVEEDELSAFHAQAVLVLGYLSVRLLGMGAHPSAADSLAALVGGALFTGLYFFVQREGAGLAVFRRPVLWGAYLFPLAGLLSAPWGEPLQVAALLVGHSAHFAALAAHPSRRSLSTFVSVVAFNAALFLVWQGTGSGEPQFYVIPAGLSLLALLRVFRGAIDVETYARLRAVAITVIYVAGAWKPLMFSDGRSMLVCVVLCVVGVGFGIALRIRSYVYLGTGFLVTCIAANLVRFGMRDHRVAAASLFLLGLLVIGSMVMLSAYRATLLQRYARVRALLATWEG